ncbi:MULTISPECIES: transporter substrate-binding domain-containing protein [Bifidobacterium]|jgi:ABC-type amino acid transport substrate-binding protein|uniref:ABC transporter substrate-binding protein n=1 Tax=Bifidobacterium tibiigranuli TaxID=2172043 RepID=A0A5N6RYH8_9BIFI|nr:transporter substrate-binding domain-containing protein [Bifidobacterium tibiigranuli]KAE8126538.1 ABC transporter substrate-binding protein [Bifidobacterium tibiigranuli]KAE8126689.1 ABC transporter substrate-binding protein [Bifidobacterium tibiigranuli]MCH3974382.1 transporter substrate-binding domain-containing protein [Bifidobacterium tibiigranuli]MCH4190043.1 transporter substrate-binding domain-containing protein [Bifidobacterium tibiigranuli]MCH4204698.1 transporter substrate-bindin
MACGRRRLQWHFRRMLCAALAVMLSAAAAGCGAAAGAAGEPDGPTISIGVALDEPGVGWLHDGEYSGFDVTVARYVAQALGYARKQVNFTQIRPVDASAALHSGEAQMLVTSMPMDGTQPKDVQGSRPYLLTQQDLLVRTGDRPAIAAPADLNGKIVCSARGSGAGARLREKAPGVIIRERESYQQCVTALLVGEADAVSADDAVLSGLAFSTGKGYLTLVGQPLGTVLRSVQVKAGEDELMSKINAVLDTMRKDGSLARALDAMRDATGYRGGSVPEIQR